VLAVLRRPAPLSAAAQTVVVVALLALAVGVVALVDETGDYVAGRPPDGGNAWPSIQALLDGDLDAFFAGQPLLGSLSLLLRAPFVGLADLLGGSEPTLYRAGALACLAGPVALGGALYRVVGRRGGPTYQGVVLAALCVFNPMTFEAVASGHPEEPLAAALVVGAVLVAARRPLAGGVLTGLAVATKQWAALALPLVMLAAPGRRVALAVVAVAVGAVLLVPMALGDRAASDRVREQVLSSRSVNELSIWYPVSPVRRVRGDGATVQDRDYRRMPFGANRGTAAPAILLLSVLLALVLWRRAGPGGPRADQVMALLALLCGLRCVLDPGNQDYYAAGTLLAICAWEAQARRGLPVIALLFALAAEMAYGPLLVTYGRGLASAIFLTLMAAFSVYMALAAFAPRRIGSLA
jgi:hypothetical protein